MAKLIMTKGLQASGKTTWGKEQVAKGSGRVKMVTKDDLRNLLDDGKWSREREKFVEEVQNRILAAGLAQGFTMIAADTNLAPKQELRLRSIAESWNAEFEVKDFTDVPLEECIKRDQKRQNYVGEQVIKRTYYQYLAPKPTAPPIDPDKEDAFIFDLDGTLADLNGRNPYDASTCENDLVREHVKLILKVLIPKGLIILMSGREDKYREQTQRRLHANDIGYDFLFMRATGDTRKDVIVKRELFEREVAPRFNARFVVDDRPQVIRGWEALGLPVFNVGNGVEF